MHAAFAFELVELMAVDDRVGASGLLTRLAANPEIDPWSLVMGTARVAVTRPCGRAHPPED